MESIVLVFVKLGGKLKFFEEVCVGNDVHRVEFSLDIGEGFLREFLFAFDVNFVYSLLPIPWFDINASLIDIFSGEFTGIEVMYQLIGNWILRDNFDIFLNDAIDKFVPCKTESSSPDDVASLGLERVVVTDLVIDLFFADLVAHLWLHGYFYKVGN